MRTPTNFDQTDRTRTAPALRYDGTGPDEYLSDSSSCTDNRSDLEPDNYNDYESNYEQEKFNDKFSPKDLLNAIREILLSPPRDMSYEKGLLEFLPIYSFIFLNEKGSSLYNAYDRDEVKNKLVIKIDQDDRAPKFSVADDISEVYGLPGIHECINGQKPLRAVIDIDASKEDMKTASVKDQEGLVITMSSDPSKCSYHILYAPALLIDHYEFKTLTELVYILTGEKFGKYIDRGLPGQNFNLRLIGLAKKDRIKRLEVRPRMLSVEKNNNPLRISVGQGILQKCADLVLQKHSKYLKDWTIEEKDSENFVYFKRKASLECTLCKRIYDKDQQWFSRVCASSGMFIVKCFWQNSDERGEVFECNPSIAEKIQKENKNLSPASHRIKGLGFPKAFIKMPSWVKYNEAFTTTEIYKERYVRPLPNEGDIYVGSSWETGKTYVLEHLTISDDVNLLVLSTRHSYSNAVTTRLNLKSYCDIDGNINLSDHKRLDEIVSIIAQAQNYLAGQLIEKLYKLVQEARRIIVMNNDLTDLNIEWIKGLRKDKLFSIIHNTYHPQEGKTFRLAPNKETVLAELWDWAKRMSLLPFENRTSASLICHLRKDVQGIIHALKTDFSELWIKEYYGKSDPVEKAYDFSNVKESWSNVDLVAYTSTLKIGVSCTNPKCIKDYICHIEQRSSNASITEKGLFQWLLNARQPIPKSEEKIVSLSQVVKVNSSIVKAEEISDVSNATIVDHETAKFLENKPRKTLEEMRSLDWHHIVECYEISPESLTEDFILKYGNYNHMKWFKAYRQLRDAGINNEMAVEAIIHKDYRDDKLAIATRAKRHRICLELLRICTPAKDIDDRVRYKANDVKAYIDSPELTSYFQGLVPKMARVFDNTDASRTINKKLTHYHLVGSFDSEGIPKLPSYQTGEKVYWDNGEDIRYAYSKLTPDELLLEKDSKTSFGPCK
ncbi:hypothetical protein C1646_776650 [Rhizophagus diaphanus]|nr:hypothetical protein C1646_776650 [Rhizophagus diaphanus] [Rhizophagus sp. MUCL 43196]